MFVTYAQNFEDVMLWRALGNVEHGFYVDVGAQHPVNDSVSLAFYERGWRGVHIEPIESYARLLREHRPDETVLEIALSNRDGLREIFEIPGTGLSTFSKDLADRHRQQLDCDLTGHCVPTMTLNAALGDFCAREVHWLKIDVEGAEREVIEGWDASRLRPWIVVVESTLPNSQTEDHAAWDPLVRSRGYRYCYFDGLNRYYVADEHRDLEAAFRAPPNVFDQFIPYGQIKAMEESERMRVQCERLKAELSEAQRQAILANERVQEVETLATSVIASSREAEARHIAAMAKIHGAAETADHAQPVVRLDDLRNSYRIVSQDDFAALVVQECRRG